MNKRLERAIQIGIPALQQYHRDLTNVAPLPKPYQMWICPSCEGTHNNEPYDMEEYRCNCGWHGDRQDLLCSNKKEENYA